MSNLVANGAAVTISKTAFKSEEPAAKTLPTVKAEATAPKATEQKKPQPAPLTIEQRIEKFKELEKLVARRDEILEAIEKLNSFTISPTGGGNLRLADSNGQTISISHPMVIADMVGSSKSKMLDLLDEVNAKFTF